MSFYHLDNSMLDEVLAFLAREPEYNVVLMYNADRFGMDDGGLPLDGYYFGRRDASGLTAVGAAYNLGSLFFYAADPQGVAGMAGHLAETGRLPRFVQGPKPQVASLLCEFRDLGRPEPTALLSEWQVLRDRVSPGIDTEGTRPARLEELDRLVAMGQAMHREIFDVEGMDEMSLGKLLGFQMEAGGAFVREVAGVVVSKAEATMIKPHAALLGGVYTVPEHRGHGHSTACVAALCRRLLEEVGAVTLSVEPENQAAYQAYRRVGFARVADWMLASFD